MTDSRYKRTRVKTRRVRTGLTCNHLSIPRQDETQSNAFQNRPNTEPPQIMEGTQNN